MTMSPQKTAKSPPAGRAKAKGSRGKQTASRKKKKKVPARYRRRTFMFDAITEEEADAIQQVLRASTASEAMRYTVRKMAELMQHVSSGAQVHVMYPDDSDGFCKDLIIDIPAGSVN